MWVGSRTIFIWVNSITVIQTFSKKSDTKKRDEWDARVHASTTYRGSAHVEANGGDGDRASGESLGRARAELNLQSGINDRVVVVVSRSSCFSSSSVCLCVCIHLSNHKSSNKPNVFEFFE